MYDPIYTETVKEAELILYFVIAGLMLRFLLPWRALQQVLLTTLFIGSTYYFFFYDSSDWALVPFSIVISAAVAHWLLLRVYVKTGAESNALFWSSFLMPVALLVAFKAQSILLIIGVSYLTFRMALAAFEIRNDKNNHLNLIEYLGFLLFPATFLAGPINPISNYREGLEIRLISLQNIGVGVARILVGYIKYRFLANIVNQLSFTTHWDTGYVMNWGDFIVSGAAYYLYIYLNFSGYTDIVIGIAAIMGFRVKENFDNPLLARNVKDFWRRWHLSLTDFVRDAVFTPVTLSLYRLFNGKYVTLAAIIAVFCLFTTLALWHGIAAGYFIFYGMHFIAFSVIEMMDATFKRYNRGLYRNYMANPMMIWVSRAITFLFLAFTCAFLELESWAQINQVVGTLGTPW